MRRALYLRDTKHLRLFYWGADDTTPLSPRAIIIPYIFVSKELSQREPRMGRALSYPAVGDRLPAAIYAFATIKGPKLVGGLERSVFVYGLSPRDASGAWDMATSLRALLR